MKEYRFTATAARNVVIMADSEEEAKQIAENKCGVWLDIESTDKRRQTSWGDQKI